MNTESEPNDNARVSIVQGEQYLAKKTERPYVEYLCAIDRRRRYEEIVGCCWEYSRVFKSTRSQARTAAMTSD